MRQNQTLILSILKMDGTVYHLDDALQLDRVRETLQSGYVLPLQVHSAHIGPLLLSWLDALLPAGGLRLALDGNRPIRVLL